VIRTISSDSCWRSWVGRSLVRQENTTADIPTATAEETHVACSHEHMVTQLANTKHNGGEVTEMKHA